MKRLLLFFVPLFVLLGMVAEGAMLEERIKLRYIEPSRLAARLDAIRQVDSAVKLIPDDKTMTLIVQIPGVETDDLKVRHRRLLINEVVAALDRPEPTLEVFLYAIQPAMLTETELANLERRIKEQPIVFPPGTTAKGMIYWNRMTLLDKEIATIEGQQGKLPGQELTGNVTVRGRLLPMSRGQNQVACALELQLIRGGVGQHPAETISVVTQVGEVSQRPMKIASIPDGQRDDDVVFYLWVRPIPPAEGK